MRCFKLRDCTSVCKINQWLESFYARYAYVVYRHTWLFVILPLAVTTCLSVGFTLVGDRFVNDTTYLFTPTDGRNRYEKASILKHWPYDEDKFVAGLSINVKRWFYVMVSAKNKSTSLLNNETLDEIILLNDYIQSNFTLTSVDGSMEFRYSDICLTYNLVCFGNGHVLALRNRQMIVDVGGPKLSYPISREYLTDDASYLGYLYGNVKVNESDGNAITDVGCIRLVYFNRRIRKDDVDYDTMSIQWREGIQNYLLNDFKSELIHLTFGNEDTFNQGLLKNAATFAPEIGITFVLMLTFTFLNSFVIMQRNGFCGVDWVRSKPLLALFGVSEPALAIASTFGLMLFIGVPIHPILVVMPFLVFAIGVDDMFIMMSAWHGTKKTDPADVRFSHTLKEAAVSITITSLSDILAFAIGSWNSLPGVRLFCVYTSVAFFFELIYQCTFYAAAMAMFAKAECSGKHCVTFKKALSLEEAKTTCQRRFKAGTLIDQLRVEADSAALQKHQTAVPQIDSSPHHQHQIDSDRAACAADRELHADRDLNFVQKVFHEYYVPALLRPTTKFLALLLFLVYLGFAGWGCAIMGNGLQPERVMFKGHYSVEFIESNYVWTNCTPVYVTVGNPANLSTSDGRNKMLRLATAFENTSHSMDEKGTYFWLREYIRYLNLSRQVEIEDTREQWCYDLQEWIKIDTRGYWRESIQWGNESAGEDPCKIKAYRFSIASLFFGTSEEMLETATLLRGIADGFAEYEVSTFNEYQYPFIDQYQMVNPTMIRNGIVAVVAMIMLSMLMIPDPVCGVFITLSSVSIDTGVSGFLAWWGVNMDGLSMITMIMATGFAVDLSSHVSYAYVRSPGTPSERVRRALEELGWPVFQGVTSTLLGVLVLGTVDAYMYQVFFKTVFLVIIFGVLHSLLFLPIALTVFAPNSNACCKKRKALNEAPNSIAPVVKGQFSTKANGHSTPERQNGIAEPVSQLASEHKTNH